MLRDLYGEGVMLFQCDRASTFLNNGLDDTLWAMNFGTGANIDAQFAPLKRNAPTRRCSALNSGADGLTGGVPTTRPGVRM